MKYSQKRATWFISFVMLLVLSPVVENWASKPKDNFPLSYYPMFSKKRKTTYSMYYLVGYDIHQNRYNIHYKLAGTGGFNQVRRQIQKAGRSNNPQIFIQQLAEQIAQKKRLPYIEMERVELVKGYYHLENFFKKLDTLPIMEKTIALQTIKRP